MKKEIKMMIMFVVGIIISSAVSVFAAIGYVDSKQVSYCPDTTNMEATTVSDAIDVLYENVDYTPIGTVSAFMGTIVPDKYLLCDGTVYNISDYPRLAEHIKTNFGSYNKFGGNGTTTFAVPDLRGEFLRGSGTATRNTGTGADVGAHQEPTRHKYFYIATNGDTRTFTGNSFTASDRYDKSSTANSRKSIAGAGEDCPSCNGIQWYTSRPTNTAVNYIIKAK